MQLYKRILVSLMSVCLCLSLFACMLPASSDAEPETPGGIGAETGNTSGTDNSDGAGDSSGTTETPDRGDEAETGGTEKKILIAYFSATGNTERVAGYIMNKTGGIGHEIVPAVPYTPDDLKYYTDCRADREQADPTARPAISGTVEHMEAYDVVFLGYPIWHGQAPRILSTFLESYDFRGKTIIPFCTSASSGLGSSDTALHALAPHADWRPGKRFSGSVSEKDVSDWVDSLSL